MKSIYFEPLKLKKAAEKIKQIHKHKADYISDISPADEDKLIKEVCALTEDKLKPYAMLLASYKLKHLATYLVCNNNDNIDMSNITKILEYRMNDDVFRIIYRGWQGRYMYDDNPECCELMKKALAENKLEYIRTHGLDKYLSVWLDYTDTEQLEYDVCKAVLYYKSASQEMEYEDAEKHYDIFGKSLAKNAQRWFYCCCPREEYLIFNDVELSNKMSAFKDKHMTMFTLNFIKKLEMKDLEKYGAFVWRRIASHIGDPYSQMFNRFWNNQTDCDEIKKKYIQWYNIQQIGRIFTDSGRCVFWKKRVFDYDDVECRLIAQNDAILMRFGEYVVIEFREVGAVYFFSQNYYDENIKPFFERSWESLTDKKSRLKNLHHYVEGFENRYEHRGDWTYKISGRLNRLMRK